MALLLAAAAALLATSLVLVRRDRALVAELAALMERVNDLTARLDGTEQDVARAVTQAEIAENVLLEKGVADEDDIAAVRQRFDPSGAGYVRERDGDLN